MDLELILCHFLLVNLLLLGTQIVFCERTYRRLTVYRNDCPTTFSFGSRSNRRLCAMECDKEPLCNRFSLDEITMECTGSFDVYTNTVFCDHSLGLVHYVADDMTLGTPCITTSDCPLQFSECTFGICSCSSASYPDFTNRQCLQTSYYGGPCAVDTDCTGSDQMCEFGYCVCRTGYIASAPEYICTEVPSMFGAPCTQHTDCIDQTLECWASSCTCKPGYSLVPATMLCAENCNIYGTTYIEYIGMDLTCNGNLKNGLSPQECKDLCSGESGCLSMSYHYGLTACQTRTCDPMTNPADWKPLQQVHTYIRNCD